MNISRKDFIKLAKKYLIAFEGYEMDKNGNYLLEIGGSEKLYEAINLIEQTLNKAPDTRKMYESACNEYVQKFCNKQELTNEGWVGNHVGEKAMCSDFYFNLTDIVFDIDSNQPKGKIIDWYGKCLTGKLISYQNYIKISKKKPKNWMNEIAGKWPNKTSDQEFEDLLKEI